MANDVNKSILIGRLTRDVETKSTSGGTTFVRFSLASNYSQKKGETWEEKANFIDCVVWGKSAENFAKYAKKGSRVCVEGALRWSSWEKDGVKHSKIEINVSEWQLLDPKEKGERGPLEGGEFGQRESAKFDPAAMDEGMPF